MNQYQQFWHNNLSHLDSQLLLDYDTFINAFCQQIYLRSDIVLTDLQKQIIKAQIDPQNQNQVYKNGFLLFVKNFWGIVSNRAKLLNMKINLTKIKSSVETIPMTGWIKVKIKYPFALDKEQNENNRGQINAIDEYLIQNDRITLIQATNPQTSQTKNIQKPLQNVGFITIGSSPNCEIPVCCDIINPRHLKIIYATNLVQEGKSTHSFKIDPIPTTSSFVRDISTSNRNRYVLDNENKYFAIKSGMRISGIGLLEGLFEIIIDSASNFEQGDINTILQGLNADRKMIMLGEPEKPQKIITNYDMEPITQAMVIDLYDRNLYYPQAKRPINTSKSLKSDKQISKTSLKFRVINKRTLQQYKHQSKMHKTLVVGRDPQKCNIVIDHISIRPIQFIFQLINQVWILRRNKEIIQMSRTQSNKSTVGIYLSKEASRNSNRLPLGTVYPQVFVIKNIIQIIIEVCSRDKEQKL